MNHKPWWACSYRTRRTRRYWRGRLPHHVCGIAHVPHKCPPKDQWNTADQAWDQYYRVFP